MRISKAKLDSLPTVRLYYGLVNYFTVPYMNAPKAASVPLKPAHFKPNGKGIPWTCGASNAILAAKDVFPHPVFYAYTIGNATYIVVAVTKGGQPKLAVRYSHGAGGLIDTYDKSRKDPKFAAVLKGLLKDTPVLHLRKGRTEAGRRTGRPVYPAGPASVGGKYSKDANKRGLTGNARRMANAGFIPREFADQVSA